MSWKGEYNDNSPHLLERLYVIMVDFFNAIVPSGVEKILMTAGGVLGAMLSFAFGDIEPLLIWLVIFVSVDFFTGTYSAIVNREWTSRKNFVGVFKKVFIFVIVALAHGVDTVFQQYFGLTIVQPMTICAYATGEFGSIIENLRRAGLGTCVPRVLRRLIIVLNEKIEEKVNMIDSKQEGAKESAKEEKSN